MRYSPVVGSHPRRRIGNHWEAYCPFRRRVGTSSSDLEDQIDVLLSIDPSVESFCEQPLRVESIIDGKPRASILDYWIRLYDGRELFREAKYQKDLDNRRHDPRLDLQLRVQEQWAAANHSNYGVLTDKLTRRFDTRIKNGKLMLGFLRTNHSEEQRNALCASIGILIAKRPYTYGELVTRFRAVSTSLAAQAIFSLLLLGQLTADVDTEPLNEDTILREHPGPLNEHPLAIQY